MALVKLVCQGCGANLDASDDQRVLQCGYCGASNELRRTVQAQPAQPPQPVPPPQQVPYGQTYAPPVQVHVSAPSSGGRRGVLVFVLVLAMLPLILGGVITYFVTSKTKEVFDRVGAQVNEALGNAGINGGVAGRRYSWASARPFLADIDGDGLDDIIGTIQETGSQQLLLTAMSGSDFATAWEIDLGRRTDLPGAALRFIPESKLVLVEIGPTLHAYDAHTGDKRWVASFPDQIQTIVLEPSGDQGSQSLWVRTVDEASHAVSLADGSLSPAKAEPSEAATNLRDDAKYDLIPELRELDLRNDSFDGVRVEQAFCPKADLPVFLGNRRQKAKDKTCAQPNGLAFATRAKGTKVPFMVGYGRADKAERWRVQLTTAGSIETVESGFGQPRAELFGDDAIISFTPSSDKNARIRRISLADGATKWETSLTSARNENVEGMVIGAKRVLVLYGLRLHILDLDSGAQLSTLGGF